MCTTTNILFGNLLNKTIIMDSCFFEDFQHAVKCYFTKKFLKVLVAIAKISSQSQQLDTCIATLVADHSTQLWLSWFAQHQVCLCYLTDNRIKAKTCREVLKPFQ